MVTVGLVEPARLPPPHLDGLETTWSRLVTAECADGERTFHVLDSAPNASADIATVLCVHGNPSWSYLWRHMFSLESDFRFVAIDHIDMGYSERTGTVRRLADRIEDLSALTNALGITGPVVTLAHDWGGPISLGWALAHQDQLSGVILCNTAVHQPEHGSAPLLIRSARKPALLDRLTVDSTAFITAAFEISRPRTPPEIRAGFLAPYDRPDRRQAIKTFVEDIPLEADHPTRSTLDDIANRLSELHEVPSLLLWGAKDPVFSDLYLHDLEDRLPHADVHRWPNASHFVTEDAPIHEAVAAWLGRLSSADPAPDAPSSTGPTRLLDAIADPDRRATPAIVEMTGDGTEISFGEFDARVHATAAGLLGAGVTQGDRVAVMIPPGIDLAVAVYAVWRAGAVGVLVDGALTPPQMTAALRSANPSWLVGIPRALAAARALRWPGTLIAHAPLSGTQQKALAPSSDLATLASTYGDDAVPPLPSEDALAGVVFTSGSTGPSKGVLYTHGQIAAQRDKMRAQYSITEDDRLVAAFAPFALYGPMLGITSVVPDMDVSAPATLDAPNFAAAVDAVDATMVFASPAALENIIRTKGAITPSHRKALDAVRLLLSAGAPVRVSLLQAMRDVTPNAIAHTPYGMTECLPVASISLPELESIGTGDGVCVGRPLPGVEVQLEPITDDGLGEILVRADHMRTGYDRLWFTTHQATRPEVGWHATGDIGRIDEAGLLWVSGRAAHMLTVPSATLAAGLGPVGIEKTVEQVDGVYMATAIGIDGTEVSGQKVAVVVQLDTPSGSPKHCGLEITDAVRASVARWLDTIDQRHGANRSLDVVAVLEVPKLPVDRRHNSKIDRTRVAEWANRVLAGGSLKGL